MTTTNTRTVAACPTRPRAWPAETLAQLHADAAAGHRPLPAAAVGAAAAAAPGAVGRRLRRPGRGIEFCAEAAGPHHRRGQRRRDLLHAVQAPPQRRLHRRGLHQHALRDHGRRPDLGLGQRPPRHRPRRDHGGRPDHPGADRVQRGVRLRAGGDGQLGVLRQPDARVHQPARRRPALRRARRAHPRRRTGVRLQAGLPGAGRLPRRPRRRGRRRRARLPAGPAAGPRARLGRAGRGRRAPTAPPPRPPRRRHLRARRRHPAARGRAGRHSSTDSPANDPDETPAGGEDKA